MSVEDLAAPRQASIAGRFARSYVRLCAVSCWAYVVFWPAMLIFNKVEQSWWAAALTVIGVGLLMWLLGFVLWNHAGEARADTERLLRNGRDAIAEILDLEVTDPGDGSNDVARLQLRIAGDEVPEFRAVYRDDHDKEAYVVGARFKAVVDPSDNLFTLVTLKRR
jgi:hypothetical protein